MSLTCTNKKLYSCTWQIYIRFSVSRVARSSNGITVTLFYTFEVYSEYTQVINNNQPWAWTCLFLSLEIQDSSRDWELPMAPITLKTPLGLVPEGSQTHEKLSRASHSISSSSTQKLTPCTSGTRRTWNTSSPWLGLLKEHHRGGSAWTGLRRMALSAREP